MPLESVTLECWQYRGSVDGLPPWLAGPGHAVSEGLATEMLSGGRRAVPGEKVLRLATGQVMGLGDYAIRPSSGWQGRTSRAGPHDGSSSSHSGPTRSAAPTSEEQRLPWRRARSANARSAALSPAIGTRLAPA